MQASDQHRRIAYIDGLRALAVLLVVAHHIGEQYFPAVAAFGLGRHGVDLFFVLSGFCLSYPTLERLARDGSATFDVAEFAKRRLIRIIPPYWAAIAALAVFG